MPRKYWLLLFAAAAALLFVGNGSLLITDSVESNYALTAKEMVLSGDWLSPQIYGHYWYDKPIFFYWLTALAYKMFGFTEFASRFFPALFGLGSVTLLAWGGSKLENARSGFFSALVLLSSVEFFLISKSVITDAVLFFFLSVRHCCFSILAIVTAGRAIGTLCMLQQAWQFSPRDRLACCCRD